MVNQNTISSQVVVGLMVSKCAVQTLSATWNTSIPTYVIGTPKVTIPITGFTQTPACGEPLEYSLDQNLPLVQIEGSNIALFGTDANQAVSNLSLTLKGKVTAN